MNEQIIAKYQEQINLHYKKVDEHRRIDNSFSTPEDEPLTEDEIKQIDDYWGKYRFAYPNIDYKSFQTFKNRSGIFDVRHCPGAIRTEYFSKHFVNQSYTMAFQNKALLSRLFPKVNMPKTIIRRMSGMYYDEDYNYISKGKAIEICKEFIELAGKAIFKPSGKSGGSGIVFVKKEELETGGVESAFKNMGINAFVVQEVLVQSDFMKAFNSTSVNTVRVTSLLYKEQIKVLAALIRIGKEGNKVDNYCSGGGILGLDVETGVTNNWAMSNDHRRITVLSNGLDLESRKLEVPNWNKIIELVTQSHLSIPYIKMISWDIALTADNTPTMIECNFAGMIQIHEAVTGPLFGELMDKLLDEYLIEKFYLTKASEDFIYKEYSDYCIITDYIGDMNSCIVPDSLDNKIVGKIEGKALEKIKECKQYSISNRLEQIC